MALSDYARGLSKDNKKRYFEKLSFLKGQDPYLLTKKDLSLSLDDLPKLTMAVITDFLIFRVSPFTQNEIRAYKSLDSFAQVAAGWIQEIRAKEINSYFCVLGKVMHSQRVNEPALKVWLILSEKGEVLASHCDCVAGLGEACTHVAAILFALEFAGKENKSVTEVLAYWIGPKSKTAFFKKIADINFSAKIENEERLDTLETERESGDNVLVLDGEEIEDFLKEYSESGCSSVLNLFFEELPEKRINNKNKRIELMNLFNDNFRNLSLAELKTVADTIDVSVNEDQVKEIERETRLQSQDKKWFLLRAGRITASNFKAVCHTKIEKPSISLLKKVCYPHLYKRVFKAGIYGCEHEKHALEAFENYHKRAHPNAIIAKSGLFLHEKFPYFAATPDGILHCDVCGQGSVEVKCPFCAKDSSISKLIQEKKTCLTLVGQPCLDHNHQYYYQVQMQMALSKTDFCFFVMWSPTDFFVEKINFDESFWQERSNVALQFHRQVILPELLAKHFTSPKEECQPSTSTENTKVASTEQMEMDVQEQIWCHCRQPDDGDQMVLCSNKKCIIKWYHAKCLQLKKIPKGKWLCDLCK